MRIFQAPECFRIGVCERLPPEGKTRCVARISQELAPAAILYARRRPLYSAAGGQERARRQA
jgi:hypothetical protein